MKPLISIIIPTYKRSYILKQVLNGLYNQTYKNFEIIVIYKLSGDDTEKVLNFYSKILPILNVKQSRGEVVEAYNIGLKCVKGEIILFLDDDAIPSPTLLEEHVKTYNKYEGIGGVSGPALSAQITEKGKVILVPENTVYPYNRQVGYYDFSWERPIKGMSNMLIYFGKDGLVHYHPHFLKRNITGIFPSLLFMGANMSVKKKALDNLQVNDQLILGFCFEQLLAYDIWNRNYKLVFNSSARVLHVVHKTSSGRFFDNPKRAALRDAEFLLTFAFLKVHHKEFSKIGYFLGFIKLIIGRILRTREYGIYISLYRIYGLLIGFIIGSTYLISNFFNGNFPIKVCLQNYFEK